MWCTVVFKKSYFNRICTSRIYGLAYLLVQKAYTTVVIINVPKQNQENICFHFSLVGAIIITFFCTVIFYCSSLISPNVFRV